LARIPTQRDRQFRKGVTGDTDDVTRRSEIVVTAFRGFSEPAVTISELPVTFVGMRTVRKLRPGSWNLLAGRLAASMYPLMVAELEEEFSLHASLQIGPFPLVWGAPERRSHCARTHRCIRAKRCRPKHGR
jgi:hypothetical protein